MAEPIWKDRFVDLGAVAQEDFEIRLDDSSGAVIYAGTAYRRPGETNCIIRINDICADYLAAILPKLALAGFTSFAVAQEFVVIADPNGTPTQVDDVTFYNDWSYDLDWDASVMGLSDPIDGLVDPNQYILQSQLPASSVTATIHFTDGSTSTIIINIAGSADFNDDFNEDFSTIDASENGGAAVLDLSQFSDVDYVEMGGKTYKVKDLCPKFIVYYVNAFGGWDSLILQGNDRESDALVRHTTGKDYDNAQPQNRGVKDYAIEVTKGWNLNTGWLDDNQSSRMHHLLNSTEVYLYDVASGRMLPVVLTDTSNEVKTYKGGGRHLVRYSFNANLAKDMVRR